MLSTVTGAIVAILVTERLEGVVGVARANDRRAQGEVVGGCTIVKLVRLVGPIAKPQTPSFQSALSTRGGPFHIQT